jgi:hypothetical protein
MTHPRTKTCVHCGEDFHRPPSGMRDMHWAAKLYCNLDCKCAANDVRLCGTAKPNRLYASADEIGAELGSTALLKRVWGVYSRVARERRLANEWEAAVVLGMAA